MTEPLRGLLAMTAASTIWGLSALFYALLDHVPPLEVLAYRTLWSLAFFAGVLALQGRLSALSLAVGTPRRAGATLVAGLLIGCNWFGFIYAVHAGWVLEAALGYYIFPLVAVLLGRVVLGERLLALQWAAVVLAAAGVAALALGLGVTPWIALGLAATFGGYGLAKRRVPAGPVVSVTGEVLMLAPLAAGWILFRGSGPDPGTHLLLALSGPLTATPLILFSYASKRVRLSTIGLVQYLNPTFQFACAVLVFGEVFTFWHGIAFPAIWVALALYSAAAIAQESSARRAASRAATSGSAVT